MIRRDALDENGRPAWALFSQREHARLAGELARNWGAPCVALLEPRDVVLPTIDRHDDGWESWDAAPDVDPATGRPIAFNEMEVEPAQAIWAESIASVADLGPLAQFMVARHFMALRERHAAESLAGARFLLDYHGRSERWLMQWQHESRHNTEQIAEQATRHLQLFDYLSLWLTCSAQTQPHDFSTPGGKNVRFSPCSAGQIVVAPWPFLTPNVTLSATGRRVAARKYASAAELIAAPAESVDFTWRLVSSLPAG